MKPLERFKMKDDESKTSDAQKALLAGELTSLGGLSLDIAKKPISTAEINKHIFGSLAKRDYTIAEINDHLYRNIAAKDYKTLFDKLQMSPRELKKSIKGGIEAASMIRRPPKASATILKNLKYGIGAGAAVYGGLKLHDYINRKDKEI